MTDAKIIVDSLRDPLVVLDSDLQVVSVNRAFTQFFDTTEEEACGASFLALCQDRWQLPRLRRLLTELLPLERPVADVELEEDTPAHGRRSFWLHARAMPHRINGYPAILLSLQDVTERKRAEIEKLRLQTAAMESTANAIFITDSEGKIEWVNPAFVELTGYSVEEAFGRTPRILKSGKQDADFYRRFWRTITRGEVWNGRVINRHKEGHLYTVEQTVTPMRDRRGAISHFVAIHEDITARIEAEKRIAHMARHDFLTDLPNRYAINERLELEFTRAKRHQGTLAVLWLDLDRFKEVNDTFGHSTGDALLVALAERLQDSVRDTDALGRLGGDEFAVIQTDLDDPEGAAELAQRLIAAASAPYEIEGQQIFMSASVGIAVYPARGADAGQLMKQADLALYRAKEEGGNRYRFFSEDMDREVQVRMALGQALHGALERGELYLEYQPQVELASRRVVGAEALLRWRHPQRGVVAPTEFVPIAEGSGLIVPIGEWVLQTACAQAKAWQEAGLRALPVAVNLSAVQFRTSNLYDTIRASLEATGLEPRYLELELTERILMDANPTIEGVLWRLADLGVRISLDDFGRGYSSLEHLRRFPFNKLKIDRSFVREMQTNLKDAAIVSALIALGTRLGLQVIAEGVEPAQELDLLIDEGCAEVQGFYFSRPVPPEVFAQILARGNERIQQQEEG